MVSDTTFRAIAMISER